MLNLHEEIVMAAPSINGVLTELIEVVQTPTENPIVTVNFQEEVMRTSEDIIEEQRFCFQSHAVVDDRRGSDQTI